MHTFRLAHWLRVAGVAALAPASAHAGVEILFDDPLALHAGQYADIQRVAVAAGQDWLSRFLAPGADPLISVQISFAPIATANGRSAASSFLGTTAGGLRLFEQGAAYEVQTGIDSNGAAADVEITLGNQGYLQTELWFDPDPVLRQAFVPLDRTDAVSVFLHEFGHAFGFNGWRDGLTGALPGDYLSTFDALVDEDTTTAGAGLYFGGSRAVGLYGAPVPLTQDLYGHFGNWGPGAGSQLAPDLMNGLAFERGARYGISELDLAVLRDLGLPVLAAAAAVPEPGTLLLALSALALLTRLRTTAQRHQAQQAQAGQGQ